MLESLHELSRLVKRLDIVHKYFKIVDTKFKQFLDCVLSSAIVINNIYIIKKSNILSAWFTTYNYNLSSGKLITPILLTVTLSTGNVLVDVRGRKSRVDFYMTPISRLVEWLSESTLRKITQSVYSGKARYIKNYWNTLREILNSPILIWSTTSNPTIFIVKDVKNIRDEVKRNMVRVEMVSNVKFISSMRSLGVLIGTWRHVEERERQRSETVSVRGREKSTLIMSVVLPKDLVEKMDKLVAKGLFASRADIVRRAVRKYLLDMEREGVIS